MAGKLLHPPLAPSGCIDEEKALAKVPEVRRRVRLSRLLAGGGLPATESDGGLTGQRAVKLGEVASSRCRHNHRGSKSGPLIGEVRTLVAKSASAFASFPATRRTS